MTGLLLPASPLARPLCLTKPNTLPEAHRAGFY
ncbi:hypothetical protein FOXB_01257 [Fusarium oxysporum f. sp. conglutinans Fo5176]|uniref:Uncharacterized protein n=1 Tax=Fusarium oxysporum (strain Fo5176) TaxID=660025 RepID=F9F4D2_FUSOF|nr:hypothetical protein FOXB_01257 [Fusarium oxysporum f. sp. conglutinans Fo5176]